MLLYYPFSIKTAFFEDEEIEGMSKDVIADKIKSILDNAFYIIRDIEDRVEDFYSREYKVSIESEEMEEQLKDLNKLVILYFHLGGSKIPGVKNLRKLARDLKRLDNYKESAGLEYIVKSNKTGVYKDIDTLNKEVSEMKNEIIYYFTKAKEFNEKSLFITYNVYNNLNLTYSDWVEDNRESRRDINKDISVDKGMDKHVDGESHNTSDMDSIESKITKYGRGIPFLMLRNLLIDYSTIMVEREILFTINHYKSVINWLFNYEGLQEQEWREGQGDSIPRIVDLYKASSSRSRKRDWKELFRNSPGFRIREERMRDITRVIYSFYDRVLSILEKSNFDIRRNFNTLSTPRLKDYNSMKGYLRIVVPKLKLEKEGLSERGALVVKSCLLFLLQLEMDLFLIKSYKTNEVEEGNGLVNNRIRYLNESKVNIKNIKERSRKIKFYSALLSLFEDNISRGEKERLNRIKWWDYKEVIREQWDYK